MKLKSPKTNWVTNLNSYSVVVDEKNGDFCRNRLDIIEFFVLLIFKHIQYKPRTTASRFESHLRRSIH
jgi:hypothetical protein